MNKILKLYEDYSSDFLTNVVRYFDHHVPNPPKKEGIGNLLNKKFMEKKKNN